MRFGLLAAALLSVVPCTAHAGIRWSIGLNFGHPHYRPCCRHYAPLIVARPYPLYVAPAPVIVQPAPVVAVGAVAPAAHESAAPPVAEAPRPLPALTATSSASSSADLEGVNDANPQVRAEAIIRLGRNKDRRAVSAITQALQKDSSVEVREAAARALGLIGSPQALPNLQQAAQADPDRDVRRSASFAADVIRANMRR